jgi:hypothetical protein
MTTKKIAELKANENLKLTPDLVEYYLNIERDTKYNFMQNTPPRILLQRGMDKEHCGLWVKEKDLSKINVCSEFKLTEYEYESGGQESGIFFKEARLLMYPLFDQLLVYLDKKSKEAKLGLYLSLNEDFKTFEENYNQVNPEPLSKQYSLVLPYHVYILDETNNPKHIKPLCLVAKGLANKHLKEVAIEQYRAVEKGIAKGLDINFSDKNNYYHQQTVVDIKFVRAREEIKDGQTIWIVKPELASVANHETYYQYRYDHDFHTGHLNSGKPILQFHNGFGRNIISFMEYINGRPFVDMPLSKYLEPELLALYTCDIDHQLELNANEIDTSNIEVKAEEEF